MKKSIVFILLISACATKPTEFKTYAAKLYSKDLTGLLPDDEKTYTFQVQNLNQAYDSLILKVAAKYRTEQMLKKNSVLKLRSVTLFNESGVNVLDIVQESRRYFRSRIYNVPDDFIKKMLYK